MSFYFFLKAERERAEKGMGEGESSRQPRICQYSGTGITRGDNCNPNTSGSSQYQSNDKKPSFPNPLKPPPAAVKSVKIVQSDGHMTDRTSSFSKCLFVIL